MLKVALIGASGRMGVTLLKAIAADESLTLTGALVSPNHSHVGRDASVLVPGLSSLHCMLSSDLDTVIANADVVIDFSTPQLTGPVVESCVRHKCAYLLATTGFGADIEEMVQKASASIAILQSANTSLGVAVLAQAVADVAKRLPAHFQIEITEAHHQHKKDAPSGTALALGSAAARARGIAHQPHIRGAGERSAESIGYSCVRAGEIIGEHTVWFVSPYERIELTHKAQSRELFAHGALHAARWLISQAPGQYRMADILKS